VGPWNVLDGGPDAPREGPILEDVWPSEKH